MPIELITAAPPNNGMRSVTGPQTQSDAPCDDCPCEYVCSGAEQPGGRPDWKQAMCCSIFQQFVRVAKLDKKKVLEPNRMPSRAVYVKLFG